MTQGLKNFLLHLGCHLADRFSDTLNAVWIQAGRMWNVRLEHDPVRPYVLYRRGQSFGFEPKTTIELASEVFGGLH